MANEKEKIVMGDIVKLKSGGPEMTVTDPTHTSNSWKYTQVDCAWFDGGEVKRSHFPADALKKIEDEPSSTAYSVG